MKSIGVDIIEIDRIQAMTEKYGDRFLKRVYTTQEVDHCRPSKGSYHHNSLAARFAAKEAFYKAANPLIAQPILWHDCEILSDKDGVPRISIVPELEKALGNPAIHLSLSHSHRYAVAIVVIE